IALLRNLFQAIDDPLDAVFHVFLAEDGFEESRSESNVDLDCRVDDFFGDFILCHLGWGSCVSSVHFAGNRPWKEGDNQWRAISPWRSLRAIFPNLPIATKALPHARGIPMARQGAKDAKDWKGPAGRIGPHGRYT
ncbi:MAG: hypothetical protein P4L46_03585, partial [Fimbriimonas sp.]|nr:hypothetical protein [Fimbriimonas sp.]